MEAGWTSIFETLIPYRAELLRTRLVDSDIDAVVVNKQDSALVSIGKVYVYVRKDDVLKAKRIIERIENDLEEMGDE